MTAVVNAPCADEDAVAGSKEVLEVLVLPEAEVVKTLNPDSAASEDIEIVE